MIGTVLLVKYNIKVHDINYLLLIINNKKTPSILAYEWSRDRWYWRTYPVLVIPHLGLTTYVLYLISPFSRICKEADFYDHQEAW